MNVKPALLILFLIFVSCTKDYTLDKESLKLVPYKGNETLVFRSSTNQLDSLLLKGTDRYSKSDNNFRLFPADTYETYVLKCTAYDAFDKVRRGDQVMIELVQTSENTNITFTIPMKGVSCFGYYSKTSLERIENTRLKIGNTFYSDVKIIENTGTYQEEGYFAKRFYWSNTEGFLGFDDKEEQWRLVKKIGTIQKL